MNLVVEMTMEVLESLEERSRSVVWNRSAIDDSESNRKGGVGIVST